MWKAAMGRDIIRYKDIYEYCIKCGACAKRCPMHAITIEKGKDHVRCNQMLEKMSPHSRDFSHELGGRKS